MYPPTVAAAQQVMTSHMDLSLLVPLGTAMQNGRAPFLGSTFNRDDYHLGVIHG